MKEINEKNMNDYAIPTELLQWLIDNVPEGSTILELGSGTGTVELCKWFKVYTIEHNEKWMNRAKDAIYINAPIQHYEGYDWYDIEILKKELPKKYDVIIVDGPPGKKIGRFGFIHNLELFDPNAIFIMDDTNRARDKTLSNQVAAKLGRPNIQHSTASMKGKNKNFDVI